MPAQRNSTTIPTRGDLSIPQAAAYLNVGLNTIRRRIAEGILPAYRIKGSNLVRICRDDLDALKQPIGGGAA